MLQAIRDRVQGWVATVIFILLIVPFAFWGINYYFGSGSDAVAARVNDQEISLAAFQRALQTARQRWRELTGSAPAGEQENLVKEQAIRALIEQELLDQFSRRIGLQAGTDQVRELIRSVPGFQGANGFDQVIYESSLRQAGYTPAAFEAQVREDMRAAQLRSALVETGFVTDGELDRILRLRYQLRDLRYAVLPADTAKEQVQVSDADIEKWYREHASEFAEPARVRIAWLELTLDAVAAEVEVTEEALHTWYEQNRDSYGVAEQRSVKQLLIPLPEDAPAERRDGAMKLAEELRAKVEAGASMEEVAEQHPENAEYAVEFTEFGFLSRDVLEKPVEDVAFSLEPGRISAPVRSNFGVHVLQVTDVRGGTVPPFEEMRERVEREYRRAEAETRFYELQEQLDTLAFEHPDTLEPAAEALGIPLQRSGYLTRESAADPDAGGVPGNPQVIEAAFSEKVLEGGENSELIEIDPEHIVVLRVFEHVPPRTIPLADVRERIITRIRFERAREEMRTRGQQVITELRNGAAPDAVAEKFGFEWQESKNVERDDPSVNRAILRAAFGAGRPEAGPVYDGVSLGSGDFALVGVTAVHDPDLESIPEAEKNRLHDELLARHAQQSWTNLMAELERTAEVTINRDNL